MFTKTNINILKKKTKSTNPHIVWEQNKKIFCNRV